MKKILSLLMAAAMTLSLVACGGGEPDRQPAIDAFNKANGAFKEATAIINDNLDTVEDETYDIFVEFNDLIAQHKAILESEDPLTQEEMDEMIAWYAEVEQWSKDAKADLESNLAEQPEDVDMGVLGLVNLVELPEGLAGTGWEFAGGFLEGAEMEQADAEEVLAQYGGKLQIVFEDEANASMVQGGGSLTGTYSVLEDGNTLGLVFDNSGTPLPYACHFADANGTLVMLLVNDDTYQTAIYFTQIVEG